MTEKSFIYLHRKITEWEWYQDDNTFRVFIHCLLKANYTPKKWQGIVIERGQFVTSQYRLADELGLSRTAVIRALKNLEKTRELNCKKTTSNTIITVLNYDEYQNYEPLKIPQQIPQEIPQQIPQKNFKKTELINKEQSYTVIGNIHTQTCACGCEIENETVFTDEEMTYLKRYAKQSNARNVTAYVNSLIKNGGAREILNAWKQETAAKSQELTPTEKAVVERQIVEKENAAFLAKFETRQDALFYLKNKSGRMLFPLQKKLMEKWGIEESEVRSGF